MQSRRSSGSDRFMRPMEYRPEVALAKSARENLMDQLGLAEGDTKDHTSSSSDDSCSDSGDPGSSQSPMLARSPMAFRTPQANSQMTAELKQMLRETQRKLRVAKTSLAESEHSRERRLKIMRKTHQSAIYLKQALIQELQDIIAEKDEHIAQLDARLKNDRTPPNSPLKTSQVGCLKKLMEQISRLHRENASLQTRYEEASEELEELRTERERLQDELLLAKETPLRSPMKVVGGHLVNQMKDLQQKVLKLERERESSLSRTDIEKELQIQVVDLQAQLKAMQLDKDSLLAENKKAAANSSHVESELSTLRAELTAVKAQNRSLRASERDNHKKLDMEAKKCSEQSSQLADLLEVVKEMEASEGQLQEEAQQVRAEARALREAHSSEVDRLHMELSTKTKEFSIAEEELRERCRQLQSALEASQASHTAAIAAAEQRGREKAADVIQRVGRMTETINKAHSSATSLAQSISSVRELAVRFEETIRSDIKSAAQKICHKFRDVSSQNRSLVSKYRREMLLRKRLHNKLVELRGNIRVLCRVRPTIQEDGAGPQAAVVVETDCDDDGVLRVLTRGSWKGFEMDKVFGHLSAQEQVFEEVKPLVVSCMDGYHICIFAYGQTGSGKTFTMEGPLDNPGINQRALQELFNLVEERREEWSYSIVVSVVEIYNEAVRDLLSLNHTEKLEIKQGPEGVYVPGLTQVEVSCLEEVNEVFALGHDNRSTGSTRMNIESSRSHALLCVTVMGTSSTTGVRTIGKLNLIDLAGSERVAKSGSDGARLLEARHINKSLSSLGDVIHSLRAKSQHTPYRNSKLTYLLQDSLGGDSKTLMVVQVAPVEKNSGETICSLNFAQRVRAVELGQASRRVVELSSCPQASPRSPMKFRQ